MVEIYYTGKGAWHIHSGEGEEATLSAVLETDGEGDYFSGHHRVLASTYLTRRALPGIFSRRLWASAPGPPGA